MKERRFPAFVASILFLLSLASPAGGQTGTGSIAGRVVDGAGAPVSGAVIAIRNLATGFRTSTLSIGNGSYSIEGLSTGVYDITVEAAGFGTSLASGVSVREGRTAVTDFTLRAPGAAGPPPSEGEVEMPPRGQEGAAPPIPSKAGPGMEIYGYAQANAIYDFDQVNPDWFDVERPTKLPAFPNEFGENGNFWAGVRPSRFGVNAWIPTGWGELKTQFEFDLFGVNPDPGDTNFHLRQAWGEIGPFLAGQTNSVFQDGTVSPIALEYWGPSGMVAFRNVQFRWAPLRGKNEVFIALERPGATADNGRVEDRVELQNIKSHFPAPDLTVHYKRSGDWGHVQLAGVLRYIGWVDTNPDEFDLTGHATGWGLNLSTNIKAGPKGTIRASVVYGEGIENYVNDAPTDIGAALNPSGNPRRPLVGEPLPVLGITAFYDFYWSKCFSSAIGYSRVDIDNSDLQLPVAFNTGQYALTNLLYYPVENVMAGLEFQWGRRTNFSDGFSVDDYRIQFTARYSFGFDLGWGKK